MKIKEFLLQKVNKDTLKKESVQRAIKLTICVAFIVAFIFQLVGCLFVPLSASAYYNEDAQTAQVIVVDELPTNDIDDNAVYIISGSADDDSIVGTWIINETPIFDSGFGTYSITGQFYASTTSSSNEFVPLSTIVIGSGSSSNYINFYREFPVIQFSPMTCYNRTSSNEWRSGWYYNGGYTSSIVTDVLFRTIVITGGTDINNETFTTWLKAIAKKQGDSGSGSSNTTYYVHYNDTWFDTDNISTAVTFLNYRINNPSIVNTLDVLLENYTGSFDSIVDMLNSTNYQEYEDFVHGLEQDSFDRGVSTGFGENVLGSAFNAPLTALNQWVLFETSSGVDVTMGGVFTGLIALSVLIILLKMFSGG